MALTRIVQTRVTEVFISEEPISNLCVVALGTTGRSVKIGSSDNQELIAGIAVGGAALSGKPVRVVTHGIVSGVICGALVSAGDRVTCTNVTSGGGLASGAGKITPINTITPAGTVARVSGSIFLTSGLLLSGALYSGFVGVGGAALIHTALISGVDGFRGEIPAFTGTAFNTQKVLGKALDHGGIGSGIRVLVALGG